MDIVCKVILHVVEMMVASLMQIMVVNGNAKVNKVKKSTWNLEQSKC